MIRAGRSCPDRSHDDLGRTTETRTVAPQAQHTPGGARAAAGAGRSRRRCMSSAAARPPTPTPPYIVAGPVPAKRVRLIDPQGVEEHADDNPWLQMRLQDGAEQQQVRRAGSSSEPRFAERRAAPSRASCAGLACACAPTPPPGRARARARLTGPHPAPVQDEAAAASGAHAAGDGEEMRPEEVIEAFACARVRGRQQKGAAFGPCRPSPLWGPLRLSLGVLQPTLPAWDSPLAAGCPQAAPRTSGGQPVCAHARLTNKRLDHEHKGRAGLAAGPAD